MRAGESLPAAQRGTTFGGGVIGQFCLGIIVSALLGLSTQGWCEIYKWTNDDGSVGFSDELSRVPEKYRTPLETRTYQGNENRGNTAPRWVEAPRAPAPPTPSRGRSGRHRSSRTAR
jgi:hypothetical protein